MAQLKTNKVDSALLLSAIQSCSPGTKIFSSQLEHSLGYSGVQIRKAIMELRREGKPIGSDHHGYFWANSQEEIEGTIQHLELRALSELETVSALRGAFDINSQISMAM